MKTRSGTTSRSGWSTSLLAVRNQRQGQCVARLASGHAQAKFSGKVFTRESGNAHARV
jgi:hypothetical protein